MLRAALAMSVAMLSVSGCTSFAGNCAEPTLVTTVGEPGEVAVDLWQRYGHHDRLTTGPTLTGAVISPDGHTVAYIRPEGEYSDTNGYPKSRVALLSLGTGRRTPLSADIPDSNVGALQWSPDGSEVAFVRRGAGPGQIVAVQVADGRERTLVELNDRQSGAFAWSSDGEELLVPTYPRSESSAGSRQPTSELWRYVIDTGYHVVVETRHQFIGAIAWSPDRRLVAMMANIPGTTRLRLYVLDLETGESTPVDRRRGGPKSLTWSGPFLLYLYNVWTPDDRLYLMRWDSRSQQRTELARPGMDDVLGRFGSSISAPSCG